MDWLNLETIQVIGGNAFSQQFAIWTTSLGLASWIHSGRVKKEMREQMSQITDAINSLSHALRQDMALQSQRIGMVEKTLVNMDTRVSELEKNK